MRGASGDVGLADRLMVDCPLDDFSLRVASLGSQVIGILTAMLYLLLECGPPTDGL